MIIIIILELIYSHPGPSPRPSPLDFQSNGHEPAWPMIFKMKSFT